MTLAQATALLEDWQALAWGEGLRGGAWRDIHALFAAEQLPPLLAARFLVEHAKRLAAEGALTPREQFHLLKVTLCNDEHELLLIFANQQKFEHPACLPALSGQVRCFQEWMKQCRYGGTWIKICLAIKPICPEERSALRDGISSEADEPMQEALEWLVEGGCGCELELERGLAGALGRGLQLLSARLQLAGQPAPQPAGPLVAPWAAASSEEEPDQEPPLAER